MGKINNYWQAKAVEQKNKELLLKCNPKLNDGSGIYILTREENGFKFAYIGQAKHILTRLAQHLVGYQHIDLSLKSHKLYSQENPTGWKISFFNCEEKDLDRLEQEYIKKSANAGYQLRNKTAGGQGKGKVSIADSKPSKGYYDGVKQGYTNAQKEVANWFDKSLDYSIKGKPNKNKEKAYDKFAKFIKNK